MIGRERVIGLCRALGRRIGPIALVLLLVGCQKTDSPTGTVTLQVDRGEAYQTITGFGGFGAQKPWWSEGEPFFDQAFVDLLINDLGITILRDDLPISFEPVNDNGDPLTLDLDRYNLSDKTRGAGSVLNQHFPYIRAMHEAGLQKLVVSIWSPPVWMKHNNHHGNGTADGYSAPEYDLEPDSTSNQLREAYYQEFAEYCVAYVRILKRQTGVDLYAISLQNEPRFSQYYASAVHSPESLAELIKVVGARFKREGIETKIMAPEDTGSLRHINRYLDAILNDPLARRYTDIFAVHNYNSDGVTASKAGAKSWLATSRKALQGDRELWMSETSGFTGDTMRDAGLALARSIYEALHYGQVTAWIYWQMSGGSDGALIDDGAPNILYHVSKQFYRHIRPGSVRVAIPSPDARLLALAFYHPTDGTKTVVMINTSASAMEVKVAGDYAGALFRAYLTSGDARHKEIPEPVTTDKNFTLPPESVLTLVST